MRNQKDLFGVKAYPLATLTDQEIDIGVFATMQRMSGARSRHAEMRARGVDPELVRKRPQIKKGIDWDNQVNSTLAELALSKTKGVYWSGMSRIYAGDSGPDEVRWISDRHNGLIVYPKDPAWKRYFLIEGSDDQFFAIGWLFGDEARELARPIKGLDIAPRHVLRTVTEDDLKIEPTPPGTFNW